MSSQHDRMLIGIDIGGTKSAAVLGTSFGRVLQRHEIPTADHKSTLDQLADSARQMMGDSAPVACGISCAGPLSTEEGLVLSPPNLPGWDRIEIVSIFQQALGLPTLLENDANAGGLAEWRWGLDRSVHNMVFLTCGTGNGAGLILDGRLYRGRQSLAGEIGHVRLTADGPVGYGKAGSVEGWTAASALARLARIRLADCEAPSALQDVDPEKLSGRDVGRAALAGDVLAVDVVRQLADYLGQTCAILLDLLNPERISLGSMACRLGDLLLDGVKAAAMRESLPAAYEACTIAPAALGERTQDLAALAVAAMVAEDENSQ